VALDPLSLESRRILIAALYFASRHEEVLEEGEKILVIDPNDSDALGWMQGAYSALGRHEESIAAAQRLVDLDPEDYWSFTTLAYAYAESGDREATLDALGAAQELGVPLKESAIVYGLLGDLDTAYEYLERALVEEPEHLFFMEADPSTAPLQSDPRWDEWWAKVERPE
jgi:tetratricopeptide (TPR) repeat protein